MSFQPEALGLGGIWGVALQAGSLPAADWAANVGISKVTGISEVSTHENMSAIVTKTLGSDHNSKQIS